MVIRPSSVTVDAPAHGQIRNLFQSIHVLHLAMAFLAFHSASKMGTMIEARVRGKIMDFDPDNGLGGLIGISLKKSEWWFFLLAAWPGGFLGV